MKIEPKSPRWLLGMFCLLFITSVSFAQDVIRVKAKVIDSKEKNALGGASVSRVGGQEKVVADDAGQFEISVPAGSSLKISVTGYSPVIVKASASMVIPMDLSSTDVDEVVVVGYGTQKRELLTASVGTITFDEIKRNIPTQSLGTILAGQIAGVNVSTPRGIPGSDPTISIRQKSTFRDNRQDVLYVIDGRIAGSGDFNRLSPNEVESITTLKDAASTAVYGARAAAGVIVVTTRRGKAGRAKVEYSFQTGFDRRARNSDLMSGVQQMEYQNRITPNSYSQTVVDKFKTINNGWGYDQLSTVWNDPSVTSHNLSISGGSDKVQYFIGASLSDQKTFLKNVTWKNYNVRANITAEITKGLTAEALLSINNNTRDFPAAEGWDDVYGKLRIWQVYQPVWTTDGNPIDYGWIQNMGAQVRGDNGYQKFNNVKPVANLKLTYKLPFVKGLSVMGQFSRSFTNNRERVFIKKYNMWVMKTTDQYIISTDPKDLMSLKKSFHTDRLQEKYEWSNDYQLNLQLNYENTFKDVHHVKAWLIYERFGTEGSNMTGTRERFPVYVSDQWRFTSGDRTDSYVDGSTLQPTGRKSFIGQLFYDYDSKYLASFAYRYDGSMQFAPDMRWGFFPSASVGWILSKEKFFRSKYIDMLKIWANAGLVGNDGIGGWQWKETYQQGSSAYLGSNPSTGVGVRYGPLVNEELTWEKTFNYNAGVDINFLKKFNASVGYFKTKTYDILGSRIQSVPPTYSRSLPASNYGEVTAQGIELALGYKGKVKNISYYVNAVASRSNAVVNVVDQNITYPWQDAIGQSTNRITTRLPEKILRTQSDLDAWNAAHPTYNYYGYKAALGQLVYQDISGPGNKQDGIVDDWDVITWQKDNNPITAGLSLGAAWKGLSMDVTFNGNFNYYQSINSLNSNVEWNRNWVKWSTDAWTPTNPNAALPLRYSANDGRDRINRDGSAFWWKKSAWVRCKNISVAYSLPQSWVNKVSMTNARVFFNAANPFIISKFNKLYYDPEMGGPNNFPIMKTFNFGASVAF